jgi:hypothetical protein
MIRSALLWPLKIAVVATALWYFLRDPLPNTAAWIVAIVAAILLHLSYAAFMTGRRRSGDLELLQRAGEPPADGKRVALVGTLKTSEPVRAPFSGRACAGYSYDIYHFVRTKRNDGSYSDRKVPDFSGVALAPCALHTSQGEFRLLSFPYLSGFPHETFTSGEHRQRASEHIRRTIFEKTTPFIGEVAALDRAMSEADGAFRKDWRVKDDDDVSEATIDEQCIPADAKVCAFGIYSAGKRSLAQDTASDSRALLLIAGDADEAARQLAADERLSGRVAVVSGALATAVVAFILFAPWNWIRAMPGSSLIVDKQTTRLKDALQENDLREIAAAIRYLDPNITFEEGARTPLMHARSAEAAQLLLDRGASVGAHDVNGYSVLMNVAEDGSPELLTLIVSRGADVNERLEANPSTTALSLAREWNRPEAVNALVKAGARE